MGYSISRQTGALVQPKRQGAPMRVIFGVASLLLVMAVIGYLAKSQLRFMNDIKVPGAAASSAAPSGAASTGNAQQQSQQIQQQFKSAVEAGIQPTRPMPDEKP
jgi:hypothetical protein